jgi:hypothetical protein
MTAPSSPSVLPEPTHPCVRCGKAVPVEVALCEDCNPLGLKQPASTQVHALAAGGIFLFVAILAVLGRIGLSGVGPFSGVAGDVVAATTGLSITISVTNEGSKDASTTCRVVEADRPVGGTGELVQTPIIPAGRTITFAAIVGSFGEQPRALAVDCQSP